MNTKADLLLAYHIFSSIPSMGYVVMFVDINIFLHRQCNGGFIDISHLYTQKNRGAIANMYLNLIEFISDL